MIGFATRGKFKDKGLEELVAEKFEKKLKHNGKEGSYLRVGKSRNLILPPSQFMWRCLTRYGV